MKAVFKLKSFLVFTWFLLISFSALSVEPLFENTQNDPDAPKSFVDKFLADLGASDRYDNSKVIDFSVLPGPFYTPEMEFGIGLSAVGLYQVGDARGTENEPSNITVNAFLSTNLSAGITVNSTTVLNGGLSRFEFNGELSKAPDVYYGQGYDAGQRNHNKIDFTHRILQVTPKYYVEVYKNLYIAAGFDFKNTRVDNPDPENANNVAVDDLEGNHEAGFLIDLTYDSRDFLLNPSKGWLFQFDLGKYLDGIGDDEFSTYQVNLANYIDLTPVPGLLAWQVKGHFTEGDVPWSYLPEVGGSENLRGYIEGRYHERQIVYTQAEYRLPIKDRHGLVTWVGSATLGEHMSDIGNDFLLSYGIGYRFRVKDRVNLRLDYAVGEHDSTVYFNVNEAF